MNDISAAMSDISTILFDVGGVLLTNGWDHTERDGVLARFGVDRAQFEERHPEANDLWEKGLITIDEYLARTIFGQPRSFTPAEFVAAMKVESRLLPHTALGIVEALAASEQVELGILSNESRELMDYRTETFGFQGYFDFFFCSAYVAMRKPSPRIYRLALDVLQAEPGEVLFIDDRSENAAAAAAVGMHAIRYKGPERLAEELAKFGIDVEWDPPEAQVEAGREAGSAAVTNS
jgi:putative hydrolase of the HAD superfamily